MNKAELISHIADKTAIPRTQVEKVLHQLSEAVRTEISQTEGSIALPGIGKLHRVVRQPRVGRNPKTGATVDIAARIAVKFKASSDLNAHVNA